VRTIRSFSARSRVATRSIIAAGGRTLADLRKVNYVILGGENASEHLLM
jgi:hypothetical protein